MERDNRSAKLPEQSDENIGSSKPTHKIDKSDKLKPTGPVRRRKEIAGPKGLEPTRYGDWEKRGRCIDF